MARLRKKKFRSGDLNSNMVILLRGYSHLLGQKSIFFTDLGTRNMLNGHFEIRTGVIIAAIQCACVGKKMSECIRPFRDTLIYFHRDCKAGHTRYGIPQR